MPKRIFITGVTGFLGAHIAETLINKGFKLIALVRKSSDLWRCEAFQNQLIYVYNDDPDWHKQVVEFNPAILIHCAWIGVEAHERNQIEIQQQNLDLADQLLQLCKHVKLDQFICLGSQAEYGYINGSVNESHKTQPNTAYGEIKLQVLAKIKNYCEHNHINWLWLRIFSVFGPKENETWLIPSLIKTMKNGSEMDMTEGKQVYSYLFIEDFKIILHKLVDKNITSGVYNISSNSPLSLMRLAEIIKSLVNPSFKINFGALPYRTQQSMHIQGEISKLQHEIGEIPFTDINFALSKTIQHYINKEGKL